MVTIHLPLAIRKYADDRAAVDVQGDDVGEALEALVRAYPDVRSRLLDMTGSVYPYFTLFVADEHLPREGYEHVPLPTGAELQIVTAVGGG